MLERDHLGSSRSIIDAHSNFQLTQPLQNSTTFRTSYGISNQLPYTNPYQHTSTSTFIENHETKRNTADVRLYQ